MSIKKRLFVMAKTLFGVWVSENFSNLEDVGKEISDQCDEAVDENVDLQFSISNADPKIKKKIAKKAKYNGLSRIKRGIDDGMQKNLKKYK